MRIRDVILWLILIPILLIWVAILLEVYVPSIDIPGIEAPGSSTAVPGPEDTSIDIPTDTSDNNPTDTEIAEAQDPIQADFSSLSNVLSFLTNAEQNIPVAFSNESKAYSYKENSKPARFEIELVKEFEARWFRNSNRQLNLIEIGVHERTSSAYKGIYAFVVGAISQTTERCAQDDDGRTTICTDNIHITDKAGIMINLQSGQMEFDDKDAFCSYFRNKTIGTINSTTAPSVLDGCSIKLDPDPNHYSRQQVLEALVDEEINGYVTDYHILESYAQENNNLKAIELKDIIKMSPENYIFLLPEDNWGLKELLDLTLSSMKCDGTYDKIYDKYDIIGENRLTVSTDKCDELESSDAWELIRALEAED